MAVHVRDKAHRADSETPRALKAGAPELVGTRVVGAGGLLSLQRLAGNRAVTQLVQRDPIAGPTPVQRLNGATPLHFGGVGQDKDDPNCTVTSKHTWASSTGNLQDLSDVQMREKIVFNTNPGNDIPSYIHHPPAGIMINGNELTKIAGNMNSPQPAEDHHSGAALGTTFQWGPNANLRKAAWTLIGIQFYQYRQLPAGAWTNLHAVPYVITRKMQQAGNQWQLTFKKTGPGVNVQAGPTNIYDLPTSTAVQDVAQSRQDQTAEWQTELGVLNGMGLGLKTLSTDTIRANNAAKTKIGVKYRYTNPEGPPASTQKAFYKPSSKDLKKVRDQAKAGTKEVKEVLEGPAPPTRIEFVLAYNTGTVRQQAWWTNENGGTYRVLLRVDRILNTADHILGSVSGQDALAAAAATVKAKDKPDAQKKCYGKGSAVHELGHMLHAKANPQRFLASTLLAPLPPVPLGGDPIRAQKEQVATINSQIMAALQGKHYPAKWNYAVANGNPSEVVAEAFAALMSTPPAQVVAEIPAGLAAVYLSYGGHRSSDIDAKLNQIFPNGIPNFTQPQDALHLI